MLGYLQCFSSLLGRERNFEIASPRLVTTQDLPYDISSVMHYSAYAFSRNRRPTIIPVDPSIALSALGQRQGMTSLDVQHVHRLYCSELMCTCWDWLVDTHFKLAQSLNYWWIITAMGIEGRAMHCMKWYWNWTNNFLCSCFVWTLHASHSTKSQQLDSTITTFLKTFIRHEAIYRAWNGCFIIYAHMQGHTLEPIDSYNSYSLLMNDS
jgi:hypothetical protein